MKKNNNRKEKSIKNKYQNHNKLLDIQLGKVRELGFLAD
jgi:hypothetical protein